MDSIPSLIAQATALHRAGRYPQAIGAYETLLSRQPEFADGWYELGYLLRLVGRFEAALNAYERALALKVRHPEEVHLNCAVILSDHLRRDSQAQSHLERALELRPTYLPALLNLGNLMEEQGRRDDASARYVSILQQPEGPTSLPLQGEALARLLHLDPPPSPDDPRLSQAKRWCAGGSAIPVRTRANLAFARGRALDSLDQVSSAFEAFAEGNRLARAQGPAYSAADAASATDALIAIAHPVAASGMTPQAGVQPLFICGMFRSGSTLVEQVLNAHSSVQAGGELEWLPRMVRTSLSPFPSSLADLDSARCAALAADYLAELQCTFPISQGLRYLSDKRPDNYVLIDLIKRLFPTARIVHSVRHPLDNGLGIFMQHLNQAAAPYANDLAAIAHHYGEYRRLMAHFKRLYPDSIHDFDYDAFVRDPAAELRMLLEFLELPFEPECLDFHRQRNTVKTASYWQVRQPLYQSASGRWARYRAHLQPLIDGLRTAGVSLENV